MNPFSLASIAATLVSLLLSVWLLITSSSAQGLQRDLQKQQEEVQAQNQLVQAQQQKLQAQQDQVQSANVLSQQLGPQVLNDLGEKAKTNDKIRGLLAHYNLTLKDQAAKPGGSAPKPSAPAPAPSNP